MMFRPIFHGPCHRVAVTATSIILAGLLLSACNPFGTSKRAELAVVSLHELYDAEQFGIIYDSASDQFREAMSRSAATAFLQDVRDRLGPVVSTVKQSNMVRTSMLLKSTVTLGYATEYEHGRAEETFVFELTDTEALLLGWNIDDSK